MNLKLRAIEDREEAERLLPLIEKGIRETSLAQREEPVAEGAGRRFLEARFARPESILLVAESGSTPVALAATSPFEDPLTGEASPMLVALYVA